MTKFNPVESWPSLDAMVEEYKDGGACNEIAAAYRHAPNLFAAHLKSLGIFRDRSAAQKAAQQRKKLDRNEVAATLALSIDSWETPDVLCNVAPRPSRVLRDFVPMLTVSVADGVLLNRMAEVLAPFDRFEVRRWQRR